MLNDGRDGPRGGGSPYMHMDPVRFNQEFSRRRFEMRYDKYKATTTRIERWLYSSFVN